MSARKLPFRGNLWNESHDIFCLKHVFPASIFYKESWWFLDTQHPLPIITAANFHQYFLKVFVLWKFFAKKQNSQRKIAGSFVPAVTGSCQHLSWWLDDFTINELCLWKFCKDSKWKFISHWLQFPINCGNVYSSSIAFDVVLAGILRYGIDLTLLLMFVWVS